MIFSLFLILIFLIKNVVYAIQNYIQSYVLLKIQCDIERRLMSGYLDQDYLFFVQRNPSELAQHIRGVSGVVGLVFMPALTAATEIIVLAFVFALLLLVQPWLTFGLIGFSALLLSSIYYFTRHKAALYGEESSKSLIDLNKWMYQAFGGIKELKILSKESFFLERAMLHSRNSAWLGMKATMLTALTRPFIEVVWFSFMIIGVVAAISLGESGAKVLPIIALLAAAAMRVMPAMNRILSASISIRQATYHVGIVTSGLRCGLSYRISNPPSPPLIEFKKNVCFESVDFEYPGESGGVLHGLSLHIEKGQSVAFVGPSGAGKTTAVDLLLGLLEPQSGKISVDGVTLTSGDIRSWRRNFGYVPQSIYLSDDTIKNNIAFGELPDQIDASRIDAVVEQAQLADVLARLPEGLDTVVGDRGARLSGGQRQRIGIARALYRNPPILILDEATSALDNETEREITRAIRALSGSKTVILIAHRLSTIAHCDQIVFLVDGVVRAAGTYDELMRDNDDFRRFATATSKR
jgi:ATP-binding cassette subfamily C protein